MKSRLWLLCDVKYTKLLEIILSQNIVLNCCNFFLLLFCMHCAIYDKTVILEEVWYVVRMKCCVHCVLIKVTPKLKSSKFNTIQHRRISFNHSNYC